MSTENGILEKAETTIRTVFKEQVEPGYTYHNIQHTMKVYRSVQELGAESELKDSDIEMLKLAALFHDTGFTDGQVGHEKRSAAYAKDFLVNHNFPEEKVETISRLILSTEKNWEPADEMERIIRDADLAGLADPMYQVESRALKHEMEFIEGREMSEKEWNTLNFRFMKDHKYLSQAAKNLYKKGKNTNLKALKKLIKVEEIKKAGISASKSAQTQFKTALRNHIDLSAIADNKANIMLSVNALIITVALPVLANQILANHYLLIPGIMLLIVCVTSMIYATLATRPIKMNGKSTLEDVKSNKSNLFFFGNFYKMNFQEYQQGIETVLSDESILDSSITRDLFFLGKSLGAKYSRLRYCYNIFMYGMTVVVIGFCIAYVLSRPGG